MTAGAEQAAVSGQIFSGMPVTAYVRGSIRPAQMFAEEFQTTPVP